MQRFIRYAAYFASAVQLAIAAAMLPETYGKDTLIVLLMMGLPILTFIALYSGPDMEESRLLRQVKKARLRDELEKLGNGRNNKKN